MILKEIFIYDFIVIMTHLSEYTIDKSGHEVIIHRLEDIITT